MISSFLSHKTDRNDTNHEQMGISKWNETFLQLHCSAVCQGSLPLPVVIGRNIIPLSTVRLHVENIQMAFLTSVGICGQVKPWGIKGEGSMLSEPLIHL